MKRNYDIHINILLYFLNFWNSKLNFICTLFGYQNFIKTSREKKEQRKKRRKKKMEKCIAKLYVYKKKYNFLFSKGVYHTKFIYFCHWHLLLFFEEKKKKTQKNEIKKSIKNLKHEKRYRDSFIIYIIEMIRML